MKKNISILSLAAIIMIALLSQCKKEDTTGPVVKITSPNSGQSYHVGDTVFVIASISDETQITSVTVRLVNSNYISVGRDYSAPVPSNNSVINLHYVIDNLDLLTGNYYIAVIASDGHNDTKEFAPIHIIEIPKVRKGIFVLTAVDSSSFKISSVDSFHIAHNVINVNGDYVASAIYSSNNELFTVGSTTGALNAFDLNDNSFLWTHPSTSTLIPTYRNLFLSDDLVYVSFYDGNIRAYDKSGAPKYMIQQQGFFIPGVILKTDQYVFSELYYTSSHQNKIGAFYLVTGTERQETLIDVNLKNIYSLDNYHLLLFGNDIVTGQGKIEIYDITGNGTTQVHTIPTGNLQRVVQLDNYRYLISHSGGIYLYDYSLNSLTPYVSGLPVYAIEYDDLNQEVFAASGNQVHVYDFNSVAEKYIILTGDSAIDVRVLYTR